MDSLEAFFKENEGKTNELLIKALYCCAGLCLLFAGLCWLSVFTYDMDPKVVFSITLFDAVVILGLIPLIKSKKGKSAQKYIIICTITFLIISLSHIPNIRLYLTFLVPPLISSFYLNEKVMMTSCIMSGVGYEIGIALRLLLEDDSTFTSLSRVQYFAAFGLGGLLEYALYCFNLFYLTRTASQLLVRSYLRRKRLNEVHNLILDGFANIVESKDKNTAEHISRTSRYVELICNKLKEKGLFPEQVNDTTIPVMIRAAPFHDLGKISVPDDILNKSSSLDKEEWNVIQHHPADGALFIQHNFVVLNDDLFTKTASEMALCHHEHVDGTGYPYKLVGDEIPVSARIMAAADIFDALVSERAYKPAFTVDEAFAELARLSGTTLDPAVVVCMTEVRPEIEKIMQEGMHDRTE